MNLSDIKNIKDLDRDDILGAVGLSLRRSSAERVLEATAFLLGGLVVGAGLALFLAPKSGKGLREDISQRIARYRDGKSISLGERGESA